MFHLFKKFSPLSFLLGSLLINTLYGRDNLNVFPLRSDEYDDFRIVIPFNITEELIEAKKYQQIELKHTRKYRLRRSFNRPAYYSLLDENLLLPIEKQGVCGACYAFTTVSKRETNFYKQTQ